PADLREIFLEARERLHGMGFALRRDRLRSAAEGFRGAARVPAHIVIDGFFSLSESELNFVKALGSRTSITLVLPRSPYGLVDFEERRLAKRLRHSSQTGFRAATVEQEAEEIARRILEAAQSGVNFREIGIVLRSHMPYGPHLETTLSRFGIPVRSYFTGP